MVVSCWPQSSGCLSPRLLAVLPGRAASLQHFDQPKVQAQLLPALQQGQVVTGGHLLKQVVMSELWLSLSHSQIPGCVCYQV